MNNITELFNAICLDEKVSDGIFNMENNDHMDVLQQHLIKRGISESDSISYRNRMIEGKYPERQAYNVNGLLVTFPTPEYKQKAIARGTHFEENPKKSQSNVFQTQPTTPPAAEPTTAPAQPAMKLEPADLSKPEPTTAPVETEKDLDSGEAEKDERTPEEKNIDARAIQQILGAAPASIDIALKYPNLESVNYTLYEALNNNFYEKNGSWYNADGNYIGKKWYCDNTKKIFISK